MIAKYKEGSLLDLEESGITIIKRDGRKEKYDIDKMRCVVDWATDNREWMANELLRDMQIKIYEEIKLVDLFDEVIKTAINKISLLQPDWENVAAKLYLQKIYKDTWNVYNQFYPHLREVLAKGVHHKIYDKDFVSAFSDSDIDKLNKAIKQKRDFLFNYKALFTFFDKYCLKYSKTKKLELPQITFMRICMFLHMNDDPDIRIASIIKLYTAVSTHSFTFATPIVLNAGTPNAQLSSCVLSAVADDTVSIMDSIENLAVYSKYKGGTAIDISPLRSKGSYIAGNQGISSGPVPFLKILESAMQGFNQGSSRPGACCVYYNWWHIDFDDLIVLKSNGGTEDTRARGLKYGLKLNQLFIRRAIDNENVTLFDPKDAQSLLELVGDDFDEAYRALENKPSIRCKQVSARGMWLKILKERSETGNIYLFHIENVNINSMLNSMIKSSNLCTEILQPASPSTLSSEELVIRENGQRQIIKRYDSGEIALCNLASVNLITYAGLSFDARAELLYTIMSAMDNTIDIAYYPVKEAQNSNKQYRFLGIGVNNFANYLATKKIMIDSQEALEESSELFDEFSYHCITASCRLARERGRFKNFYKTKWASNHLPVDFANKHALKLTKYQPNMDRWEHLRHEVSLYGVRNALMMAIAPTATSGKSINATESIEPIMNLFYKEEGTTSVPTIVPNFRKNNKYYKTGFDCDQRKLVELAAIRQMYLDQSQSVNMYIKVPDSLKEMMTLHFYGFALGMKTFYYLKQLKSGDEYVCDSCS